MIKLTLVDSGVAVWVNPDQVMLVHNGKDGETKILLSSGQIVCVKEKSEVVSRLIGSVWISSS